MTEIKTDPQKARLIVQALAKLAAHSAFAPYGDLTAGQFESMALDFVNDLAEFGMVEIESAIIAYRQDPKAKGFPTPGKLRELATRARAERRMAATPRPAGQTQESRPLRWWYRPRAMWKSHWREDQIPRDEIMMYQIWRGKMDPE